MFTRWRWQTLWGHLSPTPTPEPAPNRYRRPRARPTPGGALALRHRNRAGNPMRRGHLLEALKGALGDGDGADPGADDDPLGGTV